MAKIEKVTKIKNYKWEVVTPQKIHYYFTSYRAALAFLLTL